jgi:hypothetical protein
MMRRSVVIPAAPVGQQAPPARAAASAVKGTPQRARVPPVDYGDRLHSRNSTSIKNTGKCCKLDTKVRS